MPSARGGDTADPQACKRQSPSALDGSSLLPAAPIHFTFGLPLYSERDEVLHGDARKAQHARVRQRQSSRARCVARSPCPSGGVESQRKCQLRASCHSNLCCPSCRGVSASAGPPPAAARGYCGAGASNCSPRRSCRVSPRRDIARRPPQRGQGQAGRERQRAAAAPMRPAGASVPPSN